MEDKCPHKSKKSFKITHNIEWKTNHVNLLSTNPGYKPAKFSLAGLFGAPTDDSEESHCGSFECYRYGEWGEERHYSVAAVYCDLQIEIIVYKYSRQTFV